MRSTLLLTGIAALTFLAFAQGPPQAPQGAPQQPPAGFQGGGRGGQTPVPGGRGGPAVVPKKHILVVGMTRGFHHGSTSEGLAAFWKMGKDTNIWDTEIRTDMEWITKKQPGSEAHSLPFFDAVVLVNTTGEWNLEQEQKDALMSYVRDDGKGLVLAHAAIDANYKTWPEYAELTGGVFAAHPWNTFAAPVIIEDPTFPAMRHFAATRLILHDEMYSPKNWSRDKVNVLMRLDETKLNYTNARNAREDKDQAIAWAKSTGKGRVFYSSLGHTKEAWDNPDVIKMYVEAVKWSMGLTEGSTASHPKVQ